MSLASLTSPWVRPFTPSHRGPPSDLSRPSFAIFSKSLSAEAAATTSPPLAQAKPRRIQSIVDMRPLPACPPGGFFPLFSRFPQSRIAPGQGSSPPSEADSNRPQDVLPLGATASMGLAPESVSPCLPLTIIAITCSNSNSLMLPGGLAPLSPPSPLVPPVLEGDVGIPTLVELNTPVN